MDRPETCLHNGSNNKCSNSHKVVPLHNTALLPSHLAREVGLSSKSQPSPRLSFRLTSPLSSKSLPQALYLTTSLLDRSSVHQQVRPLVLSLPGRLPT